jgi:hypothetical protein
MKPYESTESAALYQEKKTKTNKSALRVDIEAAHGLCLLSGYIPFNSQQIYDSSIQLVEFWLYCRNAFIKYKPRSWLPC